MKQNFSYLTLVITASKSRFLTSLSYKLQEKERSFKKKKKGIKYKALEVLHPEDFAMLENQK